MKVKFVPERATKNTVKFNEVAEPGRQQAIISLYVQKNALAAMGWAEGQALEVNLEVVK